MEDESDAHMQMDRASQTGSTDRMELENGLSESASAGLPLTESASASAAEQRDMDMEYGQDGLPDPSIEDIQDSLKQDTEMSAEMAEQAHLAEEQDWKDIDAEVTIVENTSHFDSKANPQEVANEDIHPESLSQPPSSLEHGDANGQLNTSAHSQAPEQQPLEQPLEKDQLTLEASIAGASTAQADASAAGDGLTTTTTTTTLTNQEDQDNDEAYADAPDPYESNDKYYSHSELPASTSASGPLRRPNLQKDYLAHVDVFHGHEPSATSSSSDRPSAPHVSLIYNNHEYSLFRQTSTPSGDDEDVLFGEREDSQTDQQSLYYSSLEHFIEALHNVFPDMKGDGDTELSLDFGILDMRISEDNIYCSQLSLHDLDRIRVGMCQPELDRLQVTVKTGKRFAFRFNELAEHCYRMFAGSEDDSGTIFDESLDPLTGDVNEEGHEAEDYEIEGTATSILEPAIDSAVDETAEVDVAADYTNGENIEDQEESGATQQNELDDANAQAALLPVDLPSSIPPNENEVALSATSDVEDLQGDVHPPTDEPYDDPEFSQDVDQEVEAYEEHEEEEEAVDSEDLPVLQNIVPNGEDEENVVEEQVVDPDASVAEAAQQVEDYEEATYEAEEGVEHEGEAATHVDGDLPAGSDRKVDVRGNEDADNYYENLTTPINEEVVLLEHPSETSASTKDDNAQISKATVVENGHVEPATESDTKLLTSKRGREKEVDEDEEYVEGSGYYGHNEVNETPIDAKRPKIAA